MPQPLRHAVIGCGTVADYGHLPAVQRCDGLELVAICETDPQRRDAAANVYNVPGYASLAGMLDAVGIDSATVSTTLPTHQAVAIALAEAGVHCLCEKPMAATAAACDQMVAAFEAAGRVLAINFEYRFNPTMRSIKSDIDAGRLGELQSIRLAYNWDNHWHKPNVRPRRAAFLEDGFGSMDCGVHYLDLARWITGGEFARITAEGRWVEPEFTYPGHIHVLARMASGTMLSIEASFTYTLNAKDALVTQVYDFAGDAGVIHAQRDMQSSEMTVYRNLVDHTEVEKADLFKPFDAVYEEFARCASAGSTDGSALATGRDGAQAIRAVEQIIAACREGRMD